MYRMLKTINVTKQKNPSFASHFAEKEKLPVNLKKMREKRNNNFLARV